MLCIVQKFPYCDLISWWIPATMTVSQMRILGIDGVFSNFGQFLYCCLDGRTVFEREGTIVRILDGGDEEVVVKYEVDRYGGKSFSGVFVFVSKFNSLMTANFISDCFEDTEQPVFDPKGIGCRYWYVEDDDAGWASYIIEEVVGISVNYLF